MEGTRSTHTRRNQDLRRQNAADVVRLLRERGRLSRAELAQLTTLSHQALALILNQLVEIGYVIEVDATPPPRRRGRPALLYEYNAARRSVASIYIGLRYCEVTLCDGIGRPLTPNRELSPGWDPHVIVEHTVEHLHDMVHTAGVDPAHCYLTVVIHGVIDRHNHTVSTPSMDWDRVPLLAMYQQATTMAVSIHEASRAAAIAEYREGRAAGAARAVVLNLGPHISATEVSYGEIDEGFADLAGSIGECLIPGPDGLARFESLYSSVAGIRRYNDVAPVKAQWVTEVHARARAGDRDALAMEQAAVAGYAFAAMWLIAICNPDRFVVTGSIGDWAESSKAKLHSTIVEYVDERLLRDCTIAFSSSGRQSWVRGGVHAALDRQRSQEFDQGPFSRSGDTSSIRAERS